MFITGKSPFGRFVAVAFALLLGGVFVVGCGNTNRQPRYNVDEPLSVVPFKRKTRHAHVDYIYTIKSQAFSKVKKPMKGRFTASEHDVLERHGQPDYTRKGYEALTGERVTDWAWWDRKVICQFVDGELVWEGPLTDADQFLIRYGYPNHSWTQEVSDGVVRETWIYQGVIYDKRGMFASFSDEKLISYHTY